MTLNIGRKTVSIFLSATAAISIVMLLFLPFQANAKPLAVQPGVTDLHKPALFSASAARPDSSGFLHYTSAHGHFRIHYTNYGRDAVAQEYNRNPLIPDYVLFTADYLEKAYHCLHDTLGFKTPPIDNPDSPEIDIYLMTLYNVYAETWLETQNSDRSWTSYMLLNNRFDSNIFYTKGYEALAVTCAHELFHIFQLGYRYRSNDRWYMEMSSVWFEERCFPQVNDYHQYIFEYVNSWNHAINHSSQWYNNVGFNLYCHDRFSTDDFCVLKPIWEHIADQTAVNSIRTVLDSLGSSLDEALADWGRTQVLCGNQVDPGFLYRFADADSLPEISFAFYSNHVLPFGFSAPDTIGSGPITTYYTYHHLPDGLFLMQSVIPVNAQARLVKINGGASRSETLRSGSCFIDGDVYSRLVIVLASGVGENAAEFNIEAISQAVLSNLYPNPVSARGDMTLEYICDSDYSVGHLHLFDVNGRRLRSTSLSDNQLQTGRHNMRIQINALPSAVYILKLSLGKTDLIRKFTVIK